MLRKIFKTAIHLSWDKFLKKIVVCISPKEMRRAGCASPSPPAAPLRPTSQRDIDYLAMGLYIVLSPHREIADLTQPARRIYFDAANAYEFFN